MKTKDLIKVLQQLVDEYETSGAAEMMGEHEIMLDSWKLDYSGHWFYKGFSKNVEVTKSSDGVYDILASKEAWGK